MLKLQHDTFSMGRSAATQRVSHRFKLLTTLSFHHCGFSVQHPRLVRTVLFDLGETLFYPLNSSHIVHNLRRVAEEADLKLDLMHLFDGYLEVRQEVNAEYVGRPFYLHRDFVARSVARLFEKHRCPLSVANIQNFCDRQRDAVVAELRPRHDCFATLMQLKELDLKLAIVSNIDDEWLSPLCTTWKLDSWFDCILSSESAHSCKPDSSIFEQACATLDCMPSESVFVGDSEINDILGSQNAGMIAIHYCELNDPQVTKAEFQTNRLMDIPALLQANYRLPTRRHSS